jgi:class 3 adenylate cyclase/tetratricopeptide (TPR) repeat protein
MKCPRCQHESEAGAKFCEECAAPLARACAKCGRQLSPTAKFCPECANATGLPAALQPAQRFDSPGSYTPKHLAEKILTSKPALEGERKQVTVLFADLKGSMELLADRDPEEARKLLDPVLEHMMEAVHRYEGTVNQVMGDGIMALFGAPLAHEDHAMRACYAALRMQESVAQYAEAILRSHGVPVQIRVGLNSGEVVVRAIGSDLHMDYTAVGQTTHLAARMEQMAGPGSILIAADTARLAEGAMQVEALGPTVVKGLTTPVPVYRLTGAVALHTRLSASAVRGLTPFVGRQDHLNQLREAMSRAAAGRGQLVAVVGEAGAGKSRLIWEFTHGHMPAGWRLLQGRSVSYGKATSYLPLMELVKGYFQIGERDEAPTIRDTLRRTLHALDPALDPTLPALLSVLAVPTEDPRWEILDPQVRRQRTFDALKRLLMRETQVQPLLMIFEDLHWIDAETQAFLDALVESLPAARFLLLVNYRPEYQHGWGSKTYYQQLRLDSLQPDTANELLASLLGDDTSLGPLKVLLIERTARNPFFLEECVRTLLETRVLAGTSRPYRVTTPLSAIPMPATVHAVLAARIDRLPPDEKDLLQAAAVIGKVVAVPVLQAIAGPEEHTMLTGLGRLQAAEFLHESRLFPDREYTFKHALTQEVAYRSLLQERRRGLHARIVEAIETRYDSRVAEHAEVLAHHAVHGELWEKAIDYVREAGLIAYSRGALQVSLNRYEQALALLPRATASPENTRRAVDVRLDLQPPLLALGQIARMLQLCEEAQPLAQQMDDRPRLARIWVSLARHKLLTGHYADVLDDAERALKVAEATDDARLRIASLLHLAAGKMAPGEYATAAELATRVVEGPDTEVAKRVPSVTGSYYVSSSGWLEWSLAALGDFARASRYGNAAIDMADASDSPHDQATAYLMRATALADQGHWAQALPWSERAVRLCEATPIFAWLAAACSQFGRILVALGRVTDGLRYLEQGVTVQERIGIRVGRSLFLVRWAEGLLLAGDIGRARETGERALDVAAGSGERGHEALALHVLGAALASDAGGDTDRPYRHYERAKAIGEELGMRPLVAHCHFGLGKLSRRTGTRQEAQEHLATGTTMYREMHMQFWLEQAEAEIRTLGTS